MKRGNKPEFWVDDKENIIGINLGADYCAEHEHGIRGLRRSFGLDDAEDLFGVDRRRVNKIPASFVLKEFKIKNKKHFALISFHWSSASDGSYKKWLPSELYLYENDLACAWDENSFGILVTEKYEKEIKELYQAFLDKDIALGISPSHVFKNGGLAITIISRLPEDVKSSVFSADKDYYKLQVAAKATGIYKRIGKTDKNYFALSPRWADENKKEVVFWLNPYRQEIYKSGWFTVKDLDDWIANKGVILKYNK